MKHEREALEKMSSTELLLKARDLGLIDFAYYPQESTGLTVTRSLDSAADACFAEVEKRGLTNQCLEHFAASRPEAVERGMTRENIFEWQIMWALFNATDREKIIAAIIAC